MFVYLRNFGVALALFGLLAGCSTNQTVKNAWKATRSTWYTYVNQPAEVDYDETGEMDAYETSLATRMIGIDVQWQNLERVMANADKPPTNEWVQSFFQKFPWLDGFVGVNSEGKIVGQAPGAPVKPLDFSPLLKEDKKQNIRALRANVQETSMGPEVMVATPLYKDTEFLGIVAAYFDMRSLLQYSTNPEELIIISPEGVLWPGKFDFESTPLAKVKWNEEIAKSYRGKVSGSQGEFFWVNRYLGNQPIIFAVQVTDKAPAKEEQLTAVEGAMGSGARVSAGVPVFHSGLMPAERPLELPEPSLRSDADIEAGSSRSMLRPPQATGNVSRTFEPIPEVTLPE